MCYSRYSLKFGSWCEPNTNEINVVNQTQFYTLYDNDIKLDLNSDLY